MSYYCKECDETYEVDFLDKEFVDSIGKYCYKCPDCENIHLVSIIDNNLDNTKLTLSWDSNIHSLAYIEYNESSYYILRAERTDINDLYKPILHYMRAFNIDVLNVGDLELKDKNYDKNNLE